jgi:hypothetical protein
LERWAQVKDGEQWDPEAVLRQRVQELLRSFRPGKGETIYSIIHDSMKAIRGQAMDALGKMKDPTTEAYVQGFKFPAGVKVVVWFDTD